MEYYDVENIIKVWIKKQHRTINDFQQVAIINLYLNNKNILFYNQQIVVRIFLLIFIFLNFLLDLLKNGIILCNNRIPNKEIKIFEHFYLITDFYLHFITIAV